MRLRLGDKVRCVKIGGILSTAYDRLFIGDTGTIIETYKTVSDWWTGGTYLIKLDHVRDEFTHRHFYGTELERLEE